MSDARKLYTLLYDVDSASTPLWGGAALDAAIHLHVEIFLPMLAAHAKRSAMKQLTGVANQKLNTSYQRVLSGAMYQHEMTNSEQRSYTRPFRKLENGKNVVAMPPIPPLDVAFCWALHSLSPLDYIADCCRMFGAPLPTTNGLDYITAENAGEERAIIARLQWCCFARAARQMEPFNLFTVKACRPERKTILPSYLWPPYEEDGRLVRFRFNELTGGLEKRWKSPLRYNQKAAAARQKQFLFNVSDRYFDSDKSLKRGVKRYRQFLALIRDNPGIFVVPMYDIDLVWHAHILRDTRQYANDTRGFVGRFVNHKEDDDRRGGELDTGFKETARLWKKKYNEEYKDEYTSYNGRIGDHVQCVFGDARTKTIKHDHGWRESFVGHAVGCISCSTKTYQKMHVGCRNKLVKAVKVARGGQVRGGACAALYSSGYIGSATIYAKSGGARGGYLGSAHKGCGCGGAGVFSAGACMWSWWMWRRWLRWWWMLKQIIVTLYH